MDPYRQEPLTLAQAKEKYKPIDQNSIEKDIHDLLASGKVQNDEVIVYLLNVTNFPVKFYDTVFNRAADNGHLNTMKIAYDRGSKNVKTIMNAVRKSIGRYAPYDSKSIETVKWITNLPENTADNLYNLIIDNPDMISGPVDATKTTLQKLGNGSKVLTYLAKRRLGTFTVFNHLIRMIPAFNYNTVEDIINSISNPNDKEEVRKMLIRISEDPDDVKLNLIDYPEFANSLIRLSQSPTSGMFPRNVYRSPVRGSPTRKIESAYNYPRRSRNLGSPRR
jgi:hypothetical protein